MEEYISGEGEQAAAAQEQASESQVQPEAQNVPLQALEDERRKRQQAEREAEMYRSHFASVQHSQQPAQSEQDEFADDDIPTFGQLKKYAEQIQSRTTDELAELKAMQKHNDYVDVVTNYLPEALKENPLLRHEIERSPNKHELAYYLAKKSDAYMNKHHQQKASKQAERIIANSQQAGSLASVGQSVSGAPHSDYKSMSDEEFQRVAAQNLGRSIF